MEKRQFTCIVCPQGCAITVCREGGDAVISGNKCPRGEAYVRQELSDPRRSISSTVRVTGGTRPLVPVKTLHPIPKNKIFAGMAEIRSLTVQAPVSAGDILIGNAASTGVAVAATADVDKTQ